MTSDDEVIELLNQKIAEVEHQLLRLKNALAAYSNHSLPASETFAANGVLPAIVDICAYLKEKGGAVSQLDIIAAVKQIRQARYPKLLRHCSDIWRALEFHARRNRLILCVNQDGRPAELKPLPPRERGKQLYDDPEAYKQDNWFMLQPKAEEPQISRPRINPV